MSNINSIEDLMEHNKLGALLFFRDYDILLLARHRRLKYGIIVSYEGQEEVCYFCSAIEAQDIVTRMNLVGAKILSMNKILDSLFCLN